MLAMYVVGADDVQEAAEEVKVTRDKVTDVQSFLWMLFGKPKQNYRSHKCIR